MAEKKSSTSGEPLRRDPGSIGDRDVLDQALRESEARYRDLFESANDVILMVGPQGEILDVNPRAEQITGFARDELLQFNVFRDLVIPEDRPVLERSLQDLLAGRARVFEVRWRAKNGTVIVFEGNSSFRLAEDGKFLSTRCILRDVTARKQAEEQLRQQQAELAHMARVHDLGEMASGLAHELNQPLYAISNYAQGAARRVRRAAPQDTELLEVLREIVSEARRAAEIVTRLRRFVHKRELHTSTANVNDLICDVLKLLRAELRHREVHVRLELAEGLPFLFVDTVQIQQVVLNLIRNALDAMDDLADDQRELIVATRLSDGEAVEVAVCDAGRGFGPHAVGKAFDAFFTTKEDGLGMGLAISRFIVEAHGGRIWATPNAERGVTFRFTLPLSTEGWSHVA